MKGLMVGGLLSAKVGGNHRFYVPDMQGHVRQVTDVDGDAIAEYQYDAWGLIQLTAATAMAFADWGYTWDGKPGRYYVQQRHLRTDLGLWLSVDPVEGEPAYLYVGDRPTWAVDPSGGQKQWLSSGDYEYERALGARGIGNLDAWRKDAPVEPPALSTQGRQQYMRFLATPNLHANAVMETARRLAMLSDHVRWRDSQFLRMHPSTQEAIRLKVYEFEHGEAMDWRRVAASTATSAAGGLGMVALGGAAVAGGVVSAPVAGLTVILVMAWPAAEAWGDRHVEAINAGRPSAGWQAYPLAATDVAGIGDLVEGATGRSMLTGSPVVRRGERLGAGLGGAIVVSAAPRVVRLGGRLVEGATARGLWDPRGAPSISRPSSLNPVILGSYTTPSGVVVTSNALRHALTHLVDDPARMSKSGKTARLHSVFDRGLVGDRRLGRNIVYLIDYAFDASLTEKAAASAFGEHPPVGALGPARQLPRSSSRVRPALGSAIGGLQLQGKERAWYAVVETEGRVPIGTQRGTVGAVPFVSTEPEYGAKIDVYTVIVDPATRRLITIYAGWPVKN